MTPGAVGWMMQGTSCHEGGASAGGDGAGGAGEGDTIVCKCSGMNVCPGRSSPHCWRQEFI